MGSSAVKFVPSAPAPGGSGELCALSEPIEGLSPEQFWAACEACAKGREPNSNETAYDWQELEDGGLLCISTHDISGATQRTYTAVYIRPEKDEMRTLFYQTDKTLAERSLLNETVFSAHRDPFRIECVIHEKSVRVSGPFVQMVLSQILSGLGYEVETFADTPAPNDEGELSVISAPIDDPALTTESYWQKLRAKTLETGGKELPDGSVLMPDTTITMVLDGAKAMVVSTDHGGDESLTTVKARTYHRVLEDPRRVELYSITVANVEVGQIAARTGEGLVNDVLKYAQEHS